MSIIGAASGLSDQLALILENSPDGVLLVDAAGRVVAWNTAMLEASGLSPGAMALASIDTVDACLTLLDMDDALGVEPTPHPPMSRTVVTSHDGRLFERVEQQVDLTVAETGRVFWFRPLDVASGSNDAERRRLRSCSEQRRHALRMESVGRLAGGIAHDFNNMLTVMIGFSEQLQADIGDHPSLAQVLRAAQRAADLTRQLLAFSRQQVLQPRVVDVSSVLDAMGGMVDRIIGDDIRLEIDAPSGLPPVCADPAQLEQIILNLAINARDAMPRGGQLVISVRRAVLERPRPGRGVEPAGEYVQLVVRDTGSGIAPDLLNKVFEPFFTTKGMHGTGLGLSTVYGIVKQSGGFIWVESEVGAGTTFTIDLPATSLREDSAVHLEQVESDGPVRDGRRILIVEDLEPVRVVTQEMLEMDGYEVVTAASPAEALAVIDDMGDRLHLVLTDVMMPEMTGSELATAIRLKRPGLPVLFMSGLPKALDWSEPGTFLPKPFTRAMLLSHVRSRMAGGVSPA